MTTEFVKSHIVILYLHTSIICFIIDYYDNKYSVFLFLFLLSNFWEDGNPNFINHTFCHLNECLTKHVKKEKMNFTSDFQRVQSLWKEGHAYITSPKK